MLYSQFVCLLKCAWECYSSGCWLIYTLLLKPNFQSTLSLYTSTVPILKKSQYATYRENKYHQCTFCWTLEQSSFSDLFHCYQHMQLVTVVTLLISCYYSPTIRQTPQKTIWLLSGGLFRALRGLITSSSLTAHLFHLSRSQNSTLITVDEFSISSNEEEE